MTEALLQTLAERFGAEPYSAVSYVGAPSIVVPLNQLHDALHFLRYEASTRYEMLVDLSAIDEAGRGGGFTVFYHLLNLESAAFLTVRSPLFSSLLEVPTASDIWPAADWYEREVYDMFGLRFSGHPDLRRILLPDFWQGHPLLKSEAGRATERPDPFGYDPESLNKILQGYMNPEQGDDGEMVVNIGPNHPGTDGIIRLVLRLRGERITSLEQEIGYHHRGAEKVAEFHTFHNYIPYTNRIDYLGGVGGELPYVLACEQMTGIEVPPRAQAMRVMLAEIFRLSSHLVWISSLGHNLGAMGPAFYAFMEREKLFDVIEEVCGGRMHPAFYRIGGVAQDLPEGWQRNVLRSCDAVEERIPELEALTTKSYIFQTRTKGIAVYTPEQAIDWALTGPNLRACGFDFDIRKKLPYSGYEQYDFDVPVGTDGDAFTRTVLRIEEMRQSLRIIRQVVASMPDGPILSDNKPRYSLARKERALEDIETMIHHFIEVGRGLPFPRGESFFPTETSKGLTCYTLVSDGSANPYRVRIRTPSFAHFQSVKAVGVGDVLGNVICLIGSIDYVLADIDR
ncbi:NADH dehydrogenase (quinone) subunit D [Pokkaliibacter sp. MBI-7]|uniref:NADH dehydrogenase (quinone) subunit D n=1 Tax=Pokkaliibacter sp. MBI-7 TaxID=3040600 RepID=UPI00244B5DDA|nr:NADH dehydrogenase (quinone) subunit D [Pokkaliibacter sp. MBI-7]MDH2433330.1 NADH dehydrogenase (quinone) subunit D [Pokkaliibacter sp. MBI-7]